MFSKNNAILWQGTLNATDLSRVLKGERIAAKLFLEAHKTCSRPFLHSPDTTKSTVVELFLNAFRRCRRKHFQAVEDLSFDRVNAVPQLLGCNTLVAVVLFPAVQCVNASTNDPRVIKRSLTVGV